MQLVLDDPGRDAPKRAKNHHYVPRWLIKRFLPEDEGKLYAGDINTRISILTLYNWGYEGT